MDVKNQIKQTNKYVLTSVANLKVPWPNISKVVPFAATKFVFVGAKHGLSGDILLKISCKIMLIGEPDQIIMEPSNFLLEHGDTNKHLWHCRSSTALITSLQPALEWVHDGLQYAVFDCL